MHRLLLGAAAGLGATAAMSVVMLARQRVRPVAEHEPKLITEAVLGAAGSNQSETTEKALASIAHFGYGSSLGAVYGLLAPLVPTPYPLSGAAYGLLVGTASYEGWLPAFDILPPLHRFSPRRRRSLMLAHLVYGSVVGGLTGLSQRRRRELPSSGWWRLSG